MSGLEKVVVKEALPCSDAKDFLFVTAKKQQPKHLRMARRNLSISDDAIVLKDAK